MFRTSSARVAVAALSACALACAAAPPSATPATADGQSTDSAVAAADATDATADTAQFQDGVVSDALADAVKDAGVDVAPDVPVDETANDDAAQTDGTVAVDAADTVDGGGACPPGWFKPKADATCQEATCGNMASAVQAALFAAMAKAEQGCATDADCTWVATSTACQGTCGAATRKAAAPDLAATVAWLDANICKPLGYAGKCGYGTPSCKAPNVGCVLGKCVYEKAEASKCAPPQPTNTVCTGTVWTCKGGTFKAYGGSECLEATCENLAKAKNDAIQSAIEKSQACTGSDDCVHIATSTDCGGTCGASVNAGMQNDVLKVVGWVDDNLCKAFGYKTKCGYSTPKCMPPNPTCGKGMCWSTATGP